VDITRFIESGFVMCENCLDRLQNIKKKDGKAGAFSVEEEVLYSYAEMEIPDTTVLTILMKSIK
jgi:hypothetical protein